MKVNFNAIFFQQELKATTGIIIRNYEGLVMGSCTYPLGRTRDPTTTEANACLQAIIFGEEMRFRDLVVEALGRKMKWHTLSQHEGTVSLARSTGWKRCLRK
ncbi:hypothetical protein Gotri_026130 [Gossypium trilobum]|uniref:RNase H type-1 domain-containing protein n=1 Tax=Gossypium trilobum TaxID=34281 RepID=A0A7J9FSV1_9ROSI|nr:hypothetical protein [Gossypium trilobum]